MNALECLLFSMYSFQCLRGFSVSHKNMMVFSPFYNHPYSLEADIIQIQKMHFLGTWCFPRSFVYAFVCVRTGCVLPNEIEGKKKTKFSYTFRSLVTVVVSFFPCDWTICRATQPQLMWMVFLLFWVTFIYHRRCTVNGPTAGEMNDGMLSF